MSQCWNTEREKDSLRSHSEEGWGGGFLGPKGLSGHEDACCLLSVWPHGPAGP